MQKSGSRQAFFFGGTGTRSMQAASGDVSYTGVGFTPRRVRLDVGVNYVTVLMVCHGEFNDNDITGQVMYRDYQAFYSAAGDRCVFLKETVVPDQQSGVGKSMDSDGFTLTWTKTGTPSNFTANMLITAEA